MRIEDQQALVDRVLAHVAARTTDCGAEEVRVPAARYSSAERLAVERRLIFSARPLAVAPSAALRSPGDFVSLDIAGLPVLITRDKAGAARAHLNSCRHRGARLVVERRGSANALVCPYHGWTYGSDGALTAMPHREHFAGCDRDQLGLHALPAVEEAGLIWLYGRPDLAGELHALELAKHVVFATSERVWAGNWKTFVDGALEAYHFRVLHAGSIYPLFFDNLMLFDRLGDHLRVVLPKRTITSLAETSRDSWRLRAHANLVYLLFPNIVLLVQSDHVVMIAMQPVDAARTHITVTMLVPGAADRPEEYWRKNFQITLAALDEDFAMGERIYAGGPSEFIFGRNELALAAFHERLRTALAEGRDRPTGPVIAF